jgi:hypothetical protein
VDFGRALCTRTNSSGSFRLLGLDPKLAEPDRRYVAYHPTGFDAASMIEEFRLTASARRHLSASVVVPLPLPASRPAAAEIALVGGFRVSGKVLDSAGKPMSDTWVEVTKPADVGGGSASDRVRVQATVSEDDGSFSFDCVQSAAGSELRARPRYVDGPAPHIDLSSLREDLSGVALNVPEMQTYRIRVRGRDGEFLDANRFSVRIRNVWGECDVSVTESNPAMRVHLALGVKSEIDVSVEAGQVGKPVTLHAKTTLEPLTRSNEPVTVVLDLEP